MTPFKGNCEPPDMDAMTTVMCEDPACFRNRPHWPREYGCRWSHVAVDHKDGTTTTLEPYNETAPPPTKKG